ncbi:MAG TPA: fimbria/pilus periplasmic chaperone [Thermodesulfovibrionales bacterium]|nr:fimbria/pilus periplasmic chaperone [Thermodesulfovibrionales bacterium]
MMNSIYKKLALTLIGLSLSIGQAYSSEWRVAPIRLDFDQGTKSGVITVSNDSSEKVHLQIKAAEWIQDAEGKDKYSDTSDLVYFPKIMILDKNEEKVLRTGIKASSVEKEKTYRLFIEEIPQPSKAEGASVAVAIRFGVPIFIKPEKEEVRGAIEKIEMSKGVLKAVVKNSGNVHLMIVSINIKGNNKEGNEVYSKELSGWYLLNGSSRTYSTDIPQDKCKELEKVSIEVRTKEEINFNRKLDVDKEMCQP